MQEINNKEIKKNKIKLGVLWTGYCCEGDLMENLNPWFNRPESKIDFVFSCVSTPFEGYKQGNNHETIKALDFLLQSKLVQYVNISSEPMTEASARNSALQPLLKEGCDYILILDSDEFWAEKDIHNLLYFLNNEDNQFYGLMKVEFRNLVFDNKHYIKNFAPNRIWMTRINGYKLNSVVYDNDFEYVKENDDSIKASDQAFPSKLIPVELINPLHKSWNDYDRSCEKINYQVKRWSPPNGNGCSFKINEEKKRIEFDTEYFKRVGQQIPEIFKI